MEKETRGYSRLVIPLPPIKELVDEVKIRIRRAFKKDPEFFVSENFEGIVFDWTDWLVIDVTIRRFITNLPDLIEKYVGEDEMIVVDWISESDWEFVDLKKEYYEVFVYPMSYENGPFTTINVFKDFLRIHHKGSYIDIDFSDTPKMEKYINKETIPIFKKLERRGLFDIDKQYPDVGY